MSDNNKSLKQIIDFRKEKLNKIVEMGIDAYPQRYNPSHLSSEIINNYKVHKNKDVLVAGRIMSIRKMGKASFFNIQDSDGRIQIFIKRDDIGEENYNLFKLLDIGDFVGVSGFVFKTKVNEISVHAEKLTLLCKSIRPLPIVKEKDEATFDAFSDKEQRYRNRHLDLIVNSNIKDTFVINFQLEFAITTFKNYNNQQVLLECISELKNYFNIDKWQINQPIIISEVQNLIGGVNGVQTIESLTFNNISGTFQGYSQYKYGFTKATRDGVIYPSMDPSIFELKYPNSDINGRVTTY